MNERPILFSGAMVRAILDGQKTQTRRVVREQREYGGLWFGHGCSWSAAATPAGLLQVCPYGQPGDRLWVRRTFASFDAAGRRCSPRDASYAVLEDGTQVARDGRVSPPLAEYAMGAFDYIKWRPSIHMPRWASRLAMEVTEVRVQRLQEISEEDARAEGVEPVISEHWTAYDPETEGYPSFGVEPDAETIARKRLENVRHHGPKVVATARQQFELLWNSINGEREGCSWESNPWVWCVSFRRIP